VFPHRHIRFGIYPVMSNGLAIRDYISLQKTWNGLPFPCVCLRRIRIESSEENVVISLKLVRLIERHSDELAAELVVKLETSSRTADLHRVPVEELRGRIHEILRHLSEWLLTKTGHDIEQRYFKIGERRASQGVSLSDFCWAITIDQGTSVGISAASGLHARPGRHLW
jgi:hypothetical protein